MCGIFGLTHATDASRLTYLGLFALQHRGQESAGMATLAGDALVSHRGAGLVADVFDESILARLPGSTAVGHVRYATAGGTFEANQQPLLARVGGVPVALAHNGNIVNAPLLRERLEAEGSLFQGTADTEIILHLLARAPAGTFEEKLIFALNQLTGAFSLLVLTPTALHAVVDPCGYRPLVLGRLQESPNSARASYVLSSETCALDLVEAKYERDLEPGEVLSIDLASGQTTSRKLTLHREQSVSLQQARCSFEHIYFARPDSVVWNATTHDVREALGRRLAREAPAPGADVVIAVPDSGVPMAMGYAQESGIPYRVGFIRNHYVGRTFIEPTQNVRNFRVRLKLNPMRATVRGKRVVVVDDSIVRGTTSKKIIELLREAGAAEVHMRIGSPEVRYPCFYGIDTPKRKELLAQRLGGEAMRDALHADSLAFLSEESLRATLRPLQGEGWCTSCFTGQYQDLGAQAEGAPELSPRGVGQRGGKP